MKTLSSTEAKAKFNAVLAEVAASGEPVTITSHGKPIATINPAQPREVRLGRYARIVEIPEDFDAPMSDEELALWEGGE